MSALQLKLIVPGQQPIERSVDELTLVGTDGLFTVLPNHCALLGRLRPGTARIAVGGREETMALGAGVCEVGDNQVTVLAERLVEWGDVDVEKANAQLGEAQAALAALDGPGDEDWSLAEENLAWAEAVATIAKSH